MSDFYRSTFTMLWIALNSDQPLGLLDSQYLEDYDGNDGYVSIYHAVSGQRWSVPMVEIFTATPLIPHDVFRGAISLASLPDGDFQIQARVRDPVGNYKIIGAVSNPFGSEAVQQLEFKIIPGFGVMLALCPLRITFGVVFETALIVEPTFFTPVSMLGVTLPTLGITSGECC